MLKEIVVIWEREGILHTIKAVIHVWISFDDDPTPYDKLLYVEMEAKKYFVEHNVYISSSNYFVQNGLGGSDVSNRYIELELRAF